MSINGFVVNNIVEKYNYPELDNINVLRSHMNDGAFSDVASVYSSALTYNIGDYVFYSGALYRCTTEIDAAEAWNAAHWTVVKVGSEIERLRNDINVDPEPISFTSSTGTIKWANGSFGTSSNGSRSATDYTDITLYSKIRYRRMGGLSSSIPANGMAFYDVEKNYISGIPNENTLPSDGYVENYEVDVPPDAVFARFTYITDTTTYGDFYVYGIRTIYEFANDIYNKNLNNKYSFDEKIEILIGGSCNKKLSPVAYSYVINSPVVGEAISISSNSSWRCKKFVPKPNTQYTISLRAGGSVQNEYYHVVAVDDSGIVLEVDKKYKDTSGETTTFTKVFGSSTAAVWVMSRTIYQSYISIIENTSVGEEYQYGFLNKLNFARYNDETTPHTLSFLLFSDIHNDQTSAKDIVDFYINYGYFISDILNGGDIVNDVGTEDISSLMDIGLSSALSVIGNHDSSTKVNDTRNWDGVGLQGCYSKFIEPYYSNWGVTLGGTGVCYYYKDYSYNLRLIALDQSHWDSTQKTWLTNILSDSKTNNKSVLILSHYIPESTTGKECNFTVYDSPNAEYSYYTLGGGDAGTIIQNYIDAGGKFTIWLAGHSHRDRIGVCNTSTGVSVRQITKASPDRTHYEYRNDVKNRSAFEIMTIDLDNSIIKFQRIGCNSDMWLRDKNGFSYDYVNQKVIGQY